MAIPAEHLKRLEAGLSAHESVSGGGPLGGSLYQVNMIVWLVPPTRMPAASKLPTWTSPARRVTPSNATRSGGWSGSLP